MPSSQLLNLLLLFGLLACQSTADRASGEVKIPAVQLREDFQILRKTLEEGHPGLYWYSSKSAMNAYFDSTYRLIQQPMSEVDFFKVLLPVVGRIRCVHTALVFSEKTRNQRFRLAKALPFRFYFSQGKLYIHQNLIDATHEGAQLLTVNGVSVDSLIARLLLCLPADGYNQTFKQDLLNHGLFREGYALYIGQPNSFAVTARDTAGKLVQFAVPAKSQQEINQLAVARRKPRPRKDIDLTFQPHPQTAILTINTFEISTGRFNDTIKTVFRTLQQTRTKHLIIDLRNNGGGNNQNVTELFAYIADKPFRHLKKTEMLTHRFTHLNHVENAIDFRKLRGILTTEGTYSMNYLYAGTVPKKPASEFPFRGKVVVLTSGGTISAASEFVALAHAHKRALVVGEETGGCYYGATGGRYLNLILPNSGLRAVIPTIRIFIDVPEDFVHQPKGRGVIPDYTAQPTIRETITHKDVQLETALKRIDAE